MIVYLTNSNGTRTLGHVKDFVIGIEKKEITVYYTNKDPSHHDLNKLEAVMVQDNNIINVTIP